jgi:hypothetical protein
VLLVYGIRVECTRIRLVGKIVNMSHTSIIVSLLHVVDECIIVVNSPFLEV